MKALVVGEALVDIVSRPGEPEQVLPGGSPANVAVGLARLGHEAQLLTWLGRDGHGDLVTEHLRASGVRILEGGDSAAKTSTAIARIARDGGAKYDFDLTIDYPPHDPAADIAAVHIGSIGAVLDPGYAKVLALLDRAAAHATVSYDPNLRPSIMGPDAGERVGSLVARSDVVKVSDEDLAWLEPGRDPREVAREWVSTGPGLVVITLGGQGAYAITAQGVDAEVPTPAVVVADTVGAGDSFMGALLDGLADADLLGSARRADLRGMSAEALRTLLTHCTRVAAITVSRPGANPPWRREL